MMKTLRLIGFGITPLAIGFLLNWVMLALPIINGFLYMLLSLVLLILWGYFAYKLSEPAYNSIIQSLLLCAFGLVMLALVLYQELVLGAYWGNIIGFATQMFFLPWISLVSTIMSPLMGVFRLWPLYIAIWAILFIVSYIGCIIKKRR